MKRDKLMRVAPEFADLVNDISINLTKQLGMKCERKKTNRKISSRFVTKKLAEQIKRSKKIEI